MAGMRHKISKLSVTPKKKKGSEMAHMFSSQIVLQTRVPGCPSKADVITLSTGRRTASKATPSREPELCAEDLVLHFLSFSLIFRTHFEVFVLFLDNDVAHAFSPSPSFRTSVHPEC